MIWQQELKQVFTFKDYWAWETDPIFTRWILWCWHRPIYVGIPLVVLAFPLILLDGCLTAGYLFIHWGKRL